MTCKSHDLMLLSDWINKLRQFDRVVRHATPQRRSTPALTGHNTCSVFTKASDATEINKIVVVGVPYRTDWIRLPSRLKQSGTVFAVCESLTTSDSDVSRQSILATERVNDCLLFATLAQQ